MTSEAAEAAAVRLTELLKLDAVGKHVTGARVVGRGGSATVDIYLSDGSEINFDRYRDIAKPGHLAAEVATTTQATPKISGATALQVVSLVGTLAQHVKSATADEIAREWGVSFLAVADQIDVDMNDQGERWGAFLALEARDPIATARIGASSVAQCSLVVAGDDGTRYVRTGWFRAHVKAEDGTVSPIEIANRMRRIGWERPGTKGQIKATQPNFGTVRLQAFYLVPAGWEHDEPGNPVMPGNPSHTRAHTHTHATSTTEGYRVTEGAVA